MGLDDVSAMQFIVPMLALLVTVVVSGPASFASHFAWRWALARIADRQGPRPAYVLAVAVLVATGAPAAYCVLLARTLTGLPGLLIVGAMAVATLVHAAYRAECIREVANDRVLASALSNISYAGDRRARVNEAVRSSSVPSFAGAILRRSLILASIVLLAWGVVAALLY